MAFKMNKNNVNFGEGTGASPNKIFGAIGKLIKNRNRETNSAEGSVAEEPLAQDTMNPNLQANKVKNFSTGQATPDEKMDAINKIINS